MTQKVVYLGLWNPIVDYKSAREDFFEGLKNDFLSDKTPILLKFPALIGLIYTWKKKFLVVQNGHQSQLFFATSPKIWWES